MTARAFSQHGGANTIAGYAGKYFVRDVRQISSKVLDMVKMV